jgi:hypothetical protein
VEKRANTLSGGQSGGINSAEPTITPPVVFRHSNSIVQRTRNGLFLFEKYSQPPHISRQPYRQYYRLLISFTNFGQLKISPIAGD